MRQLIFEFFVTTLMFTSCCYIYRNQERIAHNDGKGYDGYYYYEVTKQIKEGNYHIIGEPPFVNRYGNHFIIGKFAQFTGKDILDSAFIVNLTGMFLTVIMLLFWLRQFLEKSWIRLVLIFSFIFTWFVPIRNLIFEPMVPDPWGAVFFMAGLLMLNQIYYRIKIKKNTTLIIFIFSITIAIGTLFRESNISLAFALPLVINPFGLINFIKEDTILKTLKINLLQLFDTYKNKQSFKFILPFAFVLIANVLVGNYIQVETSSYSYPKALVYWFYSKSLPEFLTGTFIAYGPLLVLIPFYFKNYRYLFVEKEYLSFLLLSAIFFGYFGGGDTERILFMSSFPFIFLMIGISINKLCSSNFRWWLYILLFLQSFAMRLYWDIPQHPSDIVNTPIPFFGLVGVNFQYLYLFSHHGSVNVNTILLTEYFLLIILTFLVLNPQLIGIQENRTSS